VRAGVESGSRGAIESPDGRSDPIARKVAVSSRNLGRFHLLDKLSRWAGVTAADDLGEDDIDHQERLLLRGVDEDVARLMARPYQR
jgi:hypothetical protein